MGKFNTNRTEKTGGFFRNIGNVKAQQSTRYEEAGHYIMRVECIKQGESRKGVDFIAIEKTVLQVIDNEVINPITLEKSVGHRKGEEVTHMIMMDKDAAMPEFKSTLIALSGDDEEAITEEVCDMVVSDEQPLAGLVVEMVNTLVKTKSGGLFTKKNYKRVLTPQEVEELDKADG